VLHGDVIKRTLFFCAALALGCSSDPGEPAATPTPDSEALDTLPDGAVDSGSQPNDAPVAETSIAIEGERTPMDGANPITLAAGGELVFRIAASKGVHIGFQLTFTGTADPVMQLDRWTGSAIVKLGHTDAGRGLRVLAALDPNGDATYWLRVSSTTALAGTLEITRTPFTEGLTCATDCARLLQLPLPNDPKLDGYDADSSTVYRYQFGRRDLVMFLREVSRRVAKSGRAAVIPQDLSQWNGETPGADVGALRHASHQRGKDVDISLYGKDGKAPWRTYCTPIATSDGRVCADGSITNFDATANAQQFGLWYTSDRVTMMFLDRELIEAERAVAPDASKSGLFDSKWVPYFSDGTHLQHWPNHDNHVHIRVREDTTPFIIGEPPFEAP